MSLKIANADPLNNFIQNWTVWLDVTMKSSLIFPKFGKKCHFKKIAQKVSIVFRLHLLGLSWTVESGHNELDYMFTSVKTSPVGGQLRRVRGEKEGLDAVGLQHGLDKPQVRLVTWVIVIPERSVLVLDLESFNHWQSWIKNVTKITNLVK